MEHDGEPRQAAAHLFQNVEAQLGLGTGLELKGAVAGADGDGQAVHAGGPDELLHLVGVGVGGIGSGDVHVVLDAGQTAQLTLDDDTVLVGVLHDLAGQGDVVLERMLGAVDHHGGEASVDAGLADVKVLAVVQVQGDGQARVLHGGLHQLHQVAVLGVFSGPGGHLEDDGRVGLLGSLGDTLDDLHVVHVEGTDGVAALVSLAEHLCGSN